MCALFSPAQVRNRLADGRRMLRRIQLEHLRINTGLGQSAWALYGHVRAMQPTVCVEIGSAQGFSACFIGAALYDNRMGTLYAIDPHEATEWNDAGPADTYTTMQRNLRRLGVQNRVVIMRQRSEQAASTWNRPIDLLFIDGDHSYAGVRRDWELFAPFVRPFGLVFFHDTLWDVRPDPAFARDDMGVPRFVDELREQGYPVLTLEQNFGVSVVQPTRHGVPLWRQR